MKLATDAA